MTTNRTVVATLYVGLATSVLATAVPYVDRATSNTLADHVRAGYPNYSPARIDTAANVYLAYLTGIGIVSIVGWLWTVRAVATRRSWARAAVTTLFVLGTALALTDLVLRDKSGQTALPPLLGWVGLLPCVPGLIAVVVLWRAPRERVSRQFGWVGHTHDRAPG